MTVFQEDNVAGVSCVTITCSVAWASVGVTVRGLWAGSDMCHPIPPPDSALFVHWGCGSDSFLKAPLLPGASYHLTGQPSDPHLSWVGFPFPLPPMGPGLGHGPSLAQTLSSCREGEIEGSGNCCSSTRTLNEP